MNAQRIQPMSEGQRKYLLILGVADETMAGWDRYRASNEINARAGGPDTLRLNRLQKTWNIRLKQAGLGVIGTRSAISDAPNGLRRARDRKPA